MSARSATERMRVVVTGLIGSIPLAGLTLHYLQYVLGFRDLGHDVLYLEDTGSWYYDSETESMSDDVSIPLTYLGKIMESYGLGEHWTFVDHSGEVYGVDGARLAEFLNSADLFVNVTGAGILRDEYCQVPRRVYIDTDPGYIQARIASGSPKDQSHLAMHSVHMSFGCNIGRPDCRIPACGFDWRPTVQPLVMRLWDVARPPAVRRFTTVLKWQSYDSVEYEGQVLGLKQDEFLKYKTLPSLTEVPLELAMAGQPPAEDLRGYGWRCLDARSVSDTIEGYQRYIRESGGEWSVAKSAYVKLGSGWFGDRSASYLASGRPVVMQSTGFDDWLPCGRGVFSFSTLEQARGAIGAICRAYPEHSRAAREVAETYFDSTKVLSDLIAQGMGSQERIPTEPTRLGEPS